MSDTVRVMRILVYEGTREQIERTAKSGAVPWEGECTRGSMTIKSAIVDKFPEILTPVKVEEENDG